VAEPALSPHHLGEGLVKRLLDLATLVDLPVHDLRSPTSSHPLGDLLGPMVVAPTFEANARLSLLGGSQNLDGMHQLDCALVFSTTVMALELKLGEKMMSPKQFSERFVAKTPRYSHRDTRISGSMVALLDWNGRVGPQGQPAVSLCCSGRPVQPQWLLMVRESTWRDWATAENLERVLGTAQLQGVLILEELARHVGLEKARATAVDLARESISTWFGPECLEEAQQLQETTLTLKKLRAAR